MARTFEEDYRYAEDYSGNHPVYNDQAVRVCLKCGGLILDTELHDAWHKSINAIATDLYGVDTELE